MKVLIISFLILISNFSKADLDTCLRDSKRNGNHTYPLSPLEYCADTIKSHPKKVTAQSLDGKVEMYGYKDMLYVESGSKKELLAGDQTELEEILQMRINEFKKQFLVLQKDSVSTFKLDFVGNVSPVSYLKSSIVKNATSVKLLDNEELLAIFKKDSIKLVNSNAESRHESEKTKPRLLHEISGVESQLKNPSDILFSSSEKKFYVLDSDRLLVFPANVKKGQSPLKIIKIEEARSLKQKENLIFYVNTNGHETQLDLAD